MSKLKFFDYHYETTKHAKFYDKACKLLEEAKYCAFTNQYEVNMFVHMVEMALEEKKTPGHPSRVEHHFDESGGQITISSGNVDNDIARLYYKTIRKFMETNQDVTDLVDVSENYEEL